MHLWFLFHQNTSSQSPKCKDLCENTLLGHLVSLWSQNQDLKLSISSWDLEPFFPLNLKIPQSWRGILAEARWDWTQYLHLPRSSCLFLWQESFSLVLTELSGSLDRTVVTHTFPLPRYTVFRRRGLFYDFSPLNLIYSTYPMAELNICGYLTARTGGGSDGTKSILLKNERIAAFWVTETGRDQLKTKLWGNSTHIESWGCKKFLLASEKPS